MALDSEWDCVSPHQGLPLLFPRDFYEAVALRVTPRPSLALTQALVPAPPRQPDTLT